MVQSLLASRSVRVASGTLLAYLGLSVLMPTRYMSPTAALAQANDIYNRTLGFQEVFAIGFSSRTDKRDALTLASSFSEFDIRWHEAVAFEDMAQEAIPVKVLDAELSGAEIGCWRAHLNVLATMVRQKIQTALVFEDDNDWDVNVKSQLSEFAKGVVMLQQQHGPGASPNRSPYGHNWDMLWIGHCAISPFEQGVGGRNEQGFYFIHNDTTVPPVLERLGVWDNDYLLPAILSNDTRTVFRAGSGLCTPAVAYTYEAARKIIAALSLEGRIGEQIDADLSELVSDRTLTTYSIFPSLFGSHRFAGPLSRDSDITNLDPDQEDEVHEEYSRDIVYSATMNVPRLVLGATDVLSQFPDDTIPVRQLDESYSDQISTSMEEVDLTSMPKHQIPGLNTYDPTDMEVYFEILMSIS